MFYYAILKIERGGFMGFKESFNHGKEQLEKGKKPFETASFLLLVVLLGYQWFSVINMYIFKWANNNTAFSTRLSNLPVFVDRFYDMGNNLGNFFAPLIYIGYLLLVFILVWWYCNKRGYAKWTWTLIVLFAPSIFLVPPVVLYAAYAFRVYLYRFIKSIILDFNNYDLAEDLAELEVEEEEYKETKEVVKSEKASKKKDKPEDSEEIIEDSEDDLEKVIENDDEYIE